jgi:hypothetical protein
MGIGKTKISDADLDDKNDSFELEMISTDSTPDYATMNQYNGNLIENRKLRF